MQNIDLQMNNGNRIQRISFVCVTFCGILFILFGVLPKVPSPVTRMLRPIFIALCLVTYPLSRYYKLGSQKIHVISLIYYTMIFLNFPMSSIAVEAYLSAALFMVFFFFASNRLWSEREIKYLFITLIVACNIQALIVLVSNPTLLHSSGTSHLNFLGLSVNRNPVAYALCIGPLCSVLALLYSRHNRSIFKDAFYVISCAIGYFTVFAIGCRGAFLSATLGCICIVWQKTRDCKNAAERFTRKALVVILVLAALTVAVSVSKGTYSERLFQFGEEANDSGRDVLWEEAWELIDEKPVFGGGFDYWESTGHLMGTHNTFLTFMVSTGWIGGILLGLFLIAAVFEMLKTRNLIPVAFMAEVLLHSWAEPGMDYYAYIPLTLAFIITRYLQYQSNNLERIFC